MTPEPSDTVTQSGSVTPERFGRVRAIFEAAIERPASDRRGFVDGVCAGDEGLRREVQAMLAAEGVADPLFDNKPPSSAPEEGRFPAGTVLAGRYRILGLLGKGGMGEVYKAFDLILNQTVALKFLAARGFGEAALVRFRNEVRIARQVSHPNVCRVYDLGMVEGLHFLSMEYIDGEDLASLLRRIGRLPQDKAIEFTRKICAGLSAAHDRGVLHRDLKPANIMIDGRGQVRITDFGLAGLAAEIPLSDLRSGTPAYMSPEQKAGKEVTTRSDIYSLGLVLHEMFTGKVRANTQSSPSEIVKELDPAVDRLILRCLEEDPKRRPQTALNVAMALPGADPIAAALAAGETPSPEMVAASEEKEGFRPHIAILCFAAVVLSLLVGFPLASKTNVLGRAPLDFPPDVLAYRAQELIKSIGYTAKPAFTGFGFGCCDQPVIDRLERYRPAKRDVLLASHRPPILRFWYRQHQREFDARWPFLLVGVLNSDDPPNAEPGMVRVYLDAKGRLLRLDVQPWETGSETKEADWRLLFAAAGLDLTRFHPIPSTAVPPMSSDVRSAWTGTYEDGRPEQVHVEAASWQGRAVFFEVQSLPVTPLADSFPQPSNMNFLLVLLCCCMAAAAFTAHRNFRLGRVDRRGGAVLGGATFLIAMAAWALGAYHVSTFWEVSLFAMGLSWAALAGGTIWMFYVAIEPYVRRNWPDSLISWTRLCSGQCRSVLVASHILAGIAAAEVFRLVAYPLVNLLFSTLMYSRTTYDIIGVSSLPMTLAVTLAAQQLALAFGLGLIVIVVLLRLAIRRVWVADFVAAVLLSVGQATILGPGALRVTAAISFFTAGTSVWIWMLRRLGFLAMIVMWLDGFASFFTPLASTGWLASRSITLHLIPTAIAAWAVWVIVTERGRRSADATA